jgi:hypothetical protein
MRTKTQFTSTSLTTLVAAAALTMAFGAQAQSFGGSTTTNSTTTTTPATPSNSATTKDAATLDAAFIRADANADGALSPQEASRMPAIAAKFAELDKNGDGLLSKVEFGSGYLAAQ